MAANKTIKIFAFLILVIAGALAIVIVRTRLSSIAKQDEARFIDAYIGLTVANSEYSSNTDSLKIARSEIFKATRTDSTWITNYGASLSKDLTKSARIWDEIIIKLDSIRAVPPEPDTVQVF
jgi:hypothetical protein